MATPYIPSTDAGFADWLLNFSTLLTASPTTYGLVAGDAVIVAGQQVAYAAALLLATDPSTRTPAAIAAKDSAKSSSLFIVRPYAVSISLNAGVLDTDKVAIGVTVKKLIPSPIPAPVDTPQVSFVNAVPLNTTLKVVNAATPTTKAKPFGSVGIEIWRSIGTVPATDPDQLDYAFTATKIPTVMVFQAGDQGKICTVACRYVTRGGLGGVAKVGPWSALLSFNVV